MFTIMHMASPENFSSSQAEQAVDFQGREYIPQSRLKNVVLLQPRSIGGNFENVAIHRQGLPVLSGALKQHKGPYLYDTSIWFEERSGKIDPDKDLEGVDVYCGTSLVNETPRAYEIARQAKEYHQNIKTIGGGPQMGPLWAEALEHGKYDVVVQGEGEDRIGDICDALIKLEGNELYDRLDEIGGLAYTRDGHPVLAPRRRNLVKPDYVRLLDFNAIRDLTPKNPMSAGVLETVRGCIGNCSYCEVIEQFPGYRRTEPETEIARLFQILEMADQGLITKSPRDGRVAVFISDDLHVPPLRAKKFRDERLKRTKHWSERFAAKGIDLEKQFFFISQNRAELGQDTEMIDTLLRAGNRMVYIGVESSSAENLQAIGKNQDPNQMERDLRALKDRGFTIAAMTIIGLPYDTKKSIMKMGKWARENSDYQTANFLTPLPATVNWPVNGDYSRKEGGLLLLNRDGELLNGTGYPMKGGEMPPYNLYTGRQFVHQDQRWSMQESVEIFNEYEAELRTVNRLYRFLYGQAERRSRQTGEAVPRRV